MGRVVGFVRAAALGDEIVTVNLREIGAFGLVYQGFAEQGGSLAILGTFGPPNVTNLLAQVLTSGAAAVRLFHFGMPCFWDSLTFTWSGGGAYVKSASCVFLDEPVAPWGASFYRGEVMPLINAGNTSDFGVLDVPAYCRALEVQVSGNRAFSLIVTSQQVGTDLGPAVAARVTAATGGLLTVRIPMADFQILLGVRNDDGALQLQSTVVVRALYGDGVVA
jgi:hypothetical protein